ncbi:MAG: DUF4382 domain-containing protein [Candidatus Methylomirabilales bacterium]
MAAVLFLGGAAACSVETQHAPVRGQLEVRLKDHREAITDFRRLDLDISKIGIQSGLRPQASAWLLFALPRRKIDLAQLIGGNYAVLLTKGVPAAQYRWIRIDVDRAEGVLKDGRSSPIAVFDDPVAFPFRIVSGKTTLLTVDLIVTDVSDHPGKGYELHIRNVTAEIVERPRS